MRFSIHSKGVAYDDIQCAKHMLLEFSPRNVMLFKNTKLKVTACVSPSPHPALFSLWGQWEFKHAIFEKRVFVCFSCAERKYRVFLTFAQYLFVEGKGWHVVDVQLIKELTQVLSLSAVPPCASWRKLFPASEEILESFHAKYCLWPLGCVQ